MSMDADVSAAIAHVTGATEAEVSGAPAAAANPEDVFKLAGLDRGDLKPTAPAKPTPDTSKEPEHLAAANGRVKAVKEPEDPLNEEDFDETKLSDAAALKAARERVVKARQQAAELVRASHRAHAAAAARERKDRVRAEQLDQRETRVSAIERHQNAAIADMTSGDTTKFLTAVGRLSQSGDPAGFWRNASISLAKGEPYSLKERQAMAADPELKARVDAMEEEFMRRQQAEQQQTVLSMREQEEQAKTRNLEAARLNVATPRVVAYATDPRTMASTREALAQKMLSAYEQDGRPIDIGEACRRLEADLAVHYELSQRADGQTNREKVTTGSEPEAGREPSAAPPTKPEAIPNTIPTTLGHSPATAKRPMTDAELRQSTVQALESTGFFARYGL